MFRLPDSPTHSLEGTAEPLADLIGRYAQTHVPFRADDVARRFGLGIAVVESTLRKLAKHGRVLEGEFLPGGYGREWCDANVLRRLKRRSLAKLRQEVEPVDQPRLATFLQVWQGVELSSPWIGWAAGHCGATSGLAPSSL